jgi:hypothetical protein
MSSFLSFLFFVLLNDLLEPPYVHSAGLTAELHSLPQEADKRRRCGCASGPFAGFGRWLVFKKRFLPQGDV